MAASALMSAFLGTVSNEASTLIHGELKLLCGAKDELESLRNTLSLIQDFLDDAESKQYKEKSVKKWLHNLKDVAYDAQDVISTEALRRRASPTMRVSSCFISYSSCSTPVHILFNYRLARKIKRVRERLDRIQKDGAGLGLQQSISWPGVLQRPPRETSSTVTVPIVVGRTEDLENLVRLLLSSDSVDAHGDKRFSVISIVGMSGLGKTTLAQLAYNDERMQKHFDARAWVHVSPKFDVVRIIGEILESITKQRPTLTTLKTFQNQLKDELRGKRFLFVLDDVWNLDLQGWEQLCAPFHQAKVGSKVLITTRNQGVADTVASTKSINLRVLSNVECWSILQSYAFGDGRPHDHPRLERLGRQIAEKAKGVPLAVKALGGILKPLGLDEDRWRNILEADVAQLPEDKNEIMPVLRLSYQHLPPHLKQCFAYCAVLPKNLYIDRYRLVWMWMALGFIQTQGNERMEDVGNDYFHALLGRSFFQYVENKYSMHDLMLDLSQAISEGDCIVIEDGDLGEVPIDVRDLTLCAIKLEMLEHLRKFQKLRSLLFLCKFDFIFTPVLEEVFKKLKSLRVLDLNCDDTDPIWYDELPSSMGSLQHLRYLHLYFKNIHVLPESLATLYNLQTLIASECESLDSLPEGISNLVHLRQIKANADIVSNIDGIGKLTSLQELEKFSVGKGKGHKVGELGNLNQIRGRLSISKLENVVSREESMEAKPEDKPYIDTLKLKWSENRDASPMISRLDEQVLEGLKPHSNLKKLIIKNYGGVRSAGWMQTQLHWLEELVFIDMPLWEEFSGVEEGQSFSRLRNLVISNCSKLRGLPPLPPSLSNLELDGVGLCVLPEIWGCLPKTEISSMSSLSATTAETIWRFFITLEGLRGSSSSSSSSILSSSSSYSSLSTLEISKCPNLRSLQKGLLQQDLGALTILRISDCEGLVDLPEHGLPSPIQLIVIKRCPLLKERCLAYGRPDWPKIAHIPNIQIDGVWIQSDGLSDSFFEDLEEVFKRFKEAITLQGSSSTV